MKPYMIIGGGISGLTAANALAESGHKIVLLEQSSHLGGRAVTQQEAGFSLNLGPHALYCGGPAMRAFQEWKIPFEGHPPATRGGFLVYQGAKYPMIQDATSLLKSPLLGIGEKMEAANLLRLFTGGRAPQQSMRSWIDDHVKSPKVRDFAAAITRLSTYTADMDHLSASAALTQIGLAIASGVVYLDHGWQTLIDGLAERARSLGVEIRCASPVHSIADLETEGIILALPPAGVERLTGVAFPNLRPVRAACLDLGLSSWPQGAATFGIGVDKPLYYSVHSAAAKLAPEGTALIQLAKYLVGDGDAAADRAELERFADLLAPGWRDRVALSRFLPNMTVSYAVATPEGRPAVDVLSLSGIALAGDWVGDEVLLTDAAVSSALRAVNVIQTSKRAAA